MALEVSRRQYGEDPFQYGDVRIPAGKGPFPALILIHGGFWRARYSLDLMNEMAEFLTLHGYVTWNIEYRRVGQAGGAWPGTAQDVGDAIDYLHTVANDIPIDFGRVGVVGHSAGGHLALWQAARAFLVANGELGLVNPVVQPTAIISLAGVSDLAHMYTARKEDSPVEAFLGGTPSQIPAIYKIASPIELLPFGIPQLLVHGMKDTNVPYEQSVRYYEAARAKGETVHFLSLPDADHFAVIQPTSAEWTSIMKQMQSVVPL